MSKFEKYKDFWHKVNDERKYPKILLKMTFFMY